MDVVLLQRAQAVFDAVVGLPPGERREAVREACGGDVALLALVEELLSLDDEDQAGEERLALVLDEQTMERALGPVPLEPGHLVDRYLVRRLLGVGGTARVWEVEHRTLGTRHALKVLTWAEPRMQRRLLREARTQANLVHVNVVPVTDVVDVNGAPGLLLPLIEGPPLDELLAEYRPAMAECLSLMGGIARGVAFAHDQGLVHRDLKPGNVLLDPQGELLVPRVADFGLVKGAGQKTLTRPGMLMGTLSYAAPEQLFDSSSAAGPADVWALGVLFVELLTGSRPFRGGSLQEVLDAQARGPDLSGLPPGLPAQVPELLAQMLEQDPEKRPQHAGAVAEALGAPEPLRIQGALARALDQVRHPEASSTTGHLLLDPPPAEEGPPSPRVPSVPGSQAPVAPVETGSSAHAAPPRSWRGPLLGGLVAGGLLLALALRPGAQPPAGKSPDTEPEVLVADAAAAEIHVVEAQVAATAEEWEPPDTPGPRKAEGAAEAGPPPASASEGASPAGASPQGASGGVSLPPPEQAAGAPAGEAAPAQAAEASPPEPPPSASVVVRGGPSIQRLVSKDGRLQQPGKVPVGRYRFEAQMEKRGNWVSLELPELSAGQTLTIACDHDFGYCKVDGG